MDLYQFEAGNGFNWGKFAVGVMTEEWDWVSHLPGHEGRPLLGSIGWNRRQIWVLDLQTCEGAAFQHGGLAAADLHKRKIWVCPMFEPFLEWLYTQDLSDLSKLPRYVDLADAPSALYGYRRSGGEHERDGTATDDPRQRAAAGGSPDRPPPTPPPVPPGAGRHVGR